MVLEFLVRLCLLLSFGNGPMLRRGEAFTSYVAVSSGTDALIAMYVQPLHKLLVALALQSLSNLTYAP